MSQSSARGGAHEFPYKKITKNPSKIIMATQPKRPNRLSIPPSIEEFFYCSYPDCSYKSNWEENVGRHEWTHNPTGLDCNIPCQVCPQKFLYLVSFLHHMTSKHSNKLFCPWCLFLGDDLDEFKAHMLAHMSTTSRPGRIKTVQPAAVVIGEFHCEPCSKSFTKKSSLLRHQKYYCVFNFSTTTTSAENIQAGNCSALQCDPKNIESLKPQRPKSTCNTSRKVGRPKKLNNIDLRCANCSLKFARKVNLLRHQKNICRIALMRCDQCSYRTSFPEDLRKHISIHVAGEQLKCKHFGCDYSTLWTQNLRKHQQSCKIRIPAPETSTGISNSFDILMNQLNIIAKESEYSCSFCSFKSKSRYYFKNHFMTHVGLKSLRCRRKGCSFETKRSETLRSHIRRVHPRKFHKAPLQTEVNLGLLMECEIKTEGDVGICNDSLNSLENSNIQNNKGQRTLLRCNKCSFTTLYPKNLRRHGGMHTSEKKFKCSNLGCTFTTRWANSLRQHQRSCPHRIPIAAEAFDQAAVGKIKTEGTMETLMQEVKATDGETLFYCTICSFSSKWKPSLKVHLRIHVDHKPFRCVRTGCKFRTRWSSELRKHYKFIHQLELPLKAPVQTEENLGLDMEFEIKTEGTVDIFNDIPNLVASSTLEESQITLDNNCNSNNLVTVQNNKVQGTVLRCDKCSFTTSNANNLHTHSWKHTSMKPFKCSNLGCTFMTRWSRNLRRHRQSCPNQIHNTAENSDQVAVDKIKTEEWTETLIEEVNAIEEETLFHCTICSFKSKWKSNIKVHLRVHDDHKPFCCPIEGCKYETKWSSELRKHHRILHQLELPLMAPVQTDENSGLDRECKDKIEGFVSSSTIPFACMLCEFIGDTALSALKHSCKHKTVVISLNRIVSNVETILGL